MNVERPTLRAENLRRFRQRHGLKQVVMAAKIGMLQTVLCDFENGARHISLKAIDQIAGAFGMPTWQLLQELDSVDGQPIMTVDERVVSIVAYLHAVAAQQDEYARRSEVGIWHPSDKPGPHAGFVYTKLLTQRAFMAIAATKPQGRVAMEGDVWYLVHEISHVLLNIDPAMVDEINSAIIALDYWSGRHLGLTGWDDWMYMFTLGPDLPDPWGSSLQNEEWGTVEPAVHEALLSRSLDYAVSAGLLTVSGEPTFNRAAWMPGPMLATAVEAKR